MPKLYIANLTKQRHDFIYRVPNDPRLHQQDIPLGGQRQIWSEAPVSTLRYIVEQHERYGLIPVTEVTRKRDFAGLCYSFDKPIDVEKMLFALDHNDGFLVQSSMEVRKQAAGAVMNLHAHHDSPAYLRSMSFEVLEEQKKPTDPVGLNEVIEVTLDGKPRQPRIARN